MDKNNQIIATSLVLRVCRADFSSHAGFVWPSNAGDTVEAPDWNAIPECGYGLHGWLDGIGDVSCVDYWRDKSARWLVLAVQTTDIVMLYRKCKFPRATVVHVGDICSAGSYIEAHSHTANRATIIGATHTDRSTNGHAAVGALGTATAGHSGTATAGDYGTATAGDYGTATAGYSGTATAGDSGTATAGHYGTATAGYSGTATAGYSGTATAGDYGELRISWYDHDQARKRTVIGYVGEDGILANMPYRLDANHRLQPVEQITDGSEVAGWTTRRFCARQYPGSWPLQPKLVPPFTA